MYEHFPDRESVNCLDPGLRCGDESTCGQASQASPSPALIAPGGISRDSVAMEGMCA
jgi:hypothetical protein